MRFLFAVAILVTVQAFAHTAPTQQERIEEAVSDYLIQSSQLMNPTSAVMRLFDVTTSSSEGVCEGESEDEDTKGSCVDMVCDRLGVFGCDSMDEVRQVGQICRGNHNGGCIRQTCDRLGTFGCDSMKEVAEVGRICRGHLGGRCMDVACDYLGVFGCDSMDEVEKVGAACRAVSGGCLEAVCKRLGTFGCDSINEIERVASSCRGE